MSSDHERIPIHFFGIDNSRAFLSLAAALGAGPLAPPLGVEAHRFDRLVERARLSFELTGPEAAHLWMYAHEALTPAEIDAHLRDSKRSVHRVFFYGTDDPTPIRIDEPEVTIFRTSLMGSTRLPHERAMPAPCDDLLLGVGGNLIERPWMKKPSIGFCGFVGSRFTRIAYRVLGRGDKLEALLFRERALRSFERRPGVQTRFIRRDAFWGGSVSRFHFSEERQKKVRSEFIQNLLDTDYALCARGKGNFSFRLYEALSLGRIPVLVNSDCVLPFEDVIDWRRHVLVLEQRDLPSASEKLLDFHQRLGPKGFPELQRANRQLWEDYLSPEGFFPKALAPIARPSSLS